MILEVDVVFYSFQPSYKNVVSLNLHLISGNRMSTGMIRKSSSHIKCPAVPRTGYNITSYFAFSKRPPHMRANIINRIEFTTYIEKRNRLFERAHNYFPMPGR